MSINPEINTNTAYIYDDVAATFAFGEVDDDYGCRYFGARYYDPNISIWLSVDPLSDKFPSFSPYTYVYNNPIVMEDIDGYFGTRAGAWLFKVRNGIKGNISKTDNGVHFITRERDNAQFAFHHIGTGYEAKQKNWGGINWFTRSGAGGEQETRKTFSDVVSEKIDLLLQTLGISGGAKNPSKGAGNLGEEIINAAKDINNVQKAYEGLKTLGDETGMLPENNSQGKDPNEGVYIHYQQKDSEWHGVEGALRKDSAETAGKITDEGHRVYNVKSPTKDE